MAKPLLPLASFSSCATSLLLQGAFDLLQMLLIMPGHLVELLFQGAHAGFAVHVLPAPVFFVVNARMINKPGSHRVIHVAGKLERHLRVIERDGPRILVESPEHLPGLGDDPADPVVKHGLGVGKVVQDEADGPFAGAIRSIQLLLAQLKKTEGSPPGFFQPLYDLHYLSPVGTIPAFSTIRITVRWGARVRCSTPFGTTKPCCGVSSIVRSSRSIRKRPATT